MRRALLRATAMAMVLSVIGVASPALAQDSFGGAAAPRQETWREEGQPQDLPSRPMSRGPSVRDSGPDANAAEKQDFGVPATSQLRPSAQLHGPTPTTIPGGRVVDTRQLARLLQGGQGQVMLLHAFGGMEHLPGAVAVAPASQGGSFDDEVQRGFGAYLRQATGGDTARMLVFYCAGVQCWGSYNAALRAIALGYRNVHWYRGGIEAWRQAGLPLGSATAQAPGDASR